jgi:hypothetical protein
VLIVAANEALSIEPLSAFAFHFSGKGFFRRLIPIDAFLMKQYFIVSAAGEFRISK